MNLKKINEIYEINSANLFLYILFYKFLEKINYFPKNNIHESYKYFKDIEYCKKINIYSLSSFNYIFIGLYLIKNPLKLKVFNYFYPINLFIQSIFSFLSDSVYIDKKHWSHNCDISFALYNTIIGLYLFTKYKKNKSKIIILLFGLLVQKIDVYYLQYCKNVKKYCFYHTLWHYIIPVLAIYTLRTHKTLK